MPVAILIAEDSEDDILLFQMAVKRAAGSHVFYFVNNGVEAIEWLEGTGIRADRSMYPFPSVVVTDLKMPKLNGFELLQWVRSKPRFSNLPVIAYSSSSDPDDVERAFRLGATTYFRKTSTYFDLLQFLNCMSFNHSDSITMPTNLLDNRRPFGRDRQQP